MRYKEIVEFWKSKNIHTEAELEAALHFYCIDFAFHSGKIENDNITYHDTREIFDRDGVSSYTGDLRTLFEIKNSKLAYERIIKAFGNKETVTESFVKEIQKILTNGTHDERRYSLGERPGEYKHRDYVTGKNEVGALAEDVREEMRELLEELEYYDALEIFDDRLDLKPLKEFLAKQVEKTWEKSMNKKEGLGRKSVRLQDIMS